MSTIKSVEETLLNKWNKGGHGLDYHEAKKILEEDRQAFEEAIVRGLGNEKVKPEHSPECLIVVFPEHCDCDNYVNYVKYNQALDQAIALVRSIYRDNK